MKYDLYNPVTKKVLGWAQTISSAEKMADTLLSESMPYIEVRFTEGKTVVATRANSLTADEPKTEWESLR